MGIKENFSQAVRELTGGGKEDRKSDRSIDGMKNAVAASDTSEFDAINGTEGFDADTDFDEIEKRAAAAADEYSRRQSAFEAADFVDPDKIDYGDLDKDSVSQPQQDFTQPQQSFNQPQQGFNQSQQSYNQPQQSYGQPQQSFNQPQQSYNQPQQGYNQPQQGFNQPQQSYGQPQQGYNQPQQSYGQPQQNGFRPEQPAYNPQPSFSTSGFGAPVDDNETTIISRNTVIDGNVRSFANMSVDGNIKGNVETTKDIDLNGKIVGDISCNNAKLRISQVQGNIRLKGNVYMERDTLLLGDLTSTYASINGKIKGNLSTGGKTELKSDAVVFGDISASTITVDDGAIIQGYVSTTFLNKEESKNIFPDTITIGE